MLAGERLDDQLAQRLQVAMRFAFYRQTRRPGTSRLRDAILAAHVLLRQENADRLFGRHCQVALACATAGRGGYTVAMAGAAGAALVPGRPGPTTCSPEVEQIGDVLAAYPVGAGGQPNVRFWRAAGEQDSLLLLVAGRNVSEDQWDDLAADLAGDAAERAASLLADRLAARRGGPGAVLALHGAAGATRRARGPARPARRERSAPLRLSALAATLAALLLASVLLVLRPYAEPEHVVWAREAEELVVQALATRDRERAHQLLSRAETLARRAEQAAPEPAYTALAERIALAGDEVDRIYRVRPTPLVLLAPGEAEVVGDFVLLGRDLLVQDLAARAVRRFPLDPGDSPPGLAAGAVALQADQPVEGAPVGAPVALASLPASEHHPPTAWTLDSTRSLLSLAAGREPLRLAPAERERWVRVGAMAGYDGALYLLDPARRVVLRYSVSGGGADRPLAVLDVRAAPDLDRALDLAVGQSGLYLLFPEGVIRRFSPAGAQLSFAPQAPDRPLGVISSVRTGDGPDAVYLADQDNARLVQVSATGAFVRQLRAPRGADDLEGLRRLALDGSGQVAVVLTERALLRLDLPSEIPAPLGGPEPPGEETRTPK